MSRSVSQIKASYFRISAIATVNVVIFALALMIATLVAITRASTAPESAQGRPSSITGLQTYEGLVTETQCGAKHSSSIGRTAADCTLLCVRGGAHFVLVDGDTAYLLEGDLIALKQVAGRRVRIMGTLNRGKISVTSVVTT
jgi:hypothetical protein